MDDSKVIDFLWPNKISLLHRYINSNKNIDVYIQYLKNRFTDSDSIEESLYRIKNNIEEKPVCLKCGKKIDYIRGKFNKYCSRSCQIDNDKIKKSIKNKYKVDNISQLDFVKEKVKKTNLERYGVENTFNLEKSINKSIFTRQHNKKEWIEKIKNTNINKYGVDNVSKNDSIKEKIKNTNIKRYGFESWTQTDKGKKRISEIVSSKEVQEKIYNRKKKNHSFNISKSEDISFSLLKEKYDNVIKQYKSEVYPFSCDFFIPQIDTYIECNYHWTHGGHPYNKDNENDIIKLEKWSLKNTKYYNNAINTWTIRDVHKRNIAKENNLKLIEFWNIDELKKWLKIG